MKASEESNEKMLGVKNCFVLDKKYVESLSAQSMDAGKNDI